MDRLLRYLCGMTLMIGVLALPSSCGDAGGDSYAQQQELERAPVVHAVDVASASKAP